MGCNEVVKFSIVVKQSRELFCSISEWINVILSPAYVVCGSVKFSVIFVCLSISVTDPDLAKGWPGSANAIYPYIKQWGGSLVTCVLQEGKVFSHLCLSVNLSNRSRIWPRGWPGSANAIYPYIKQWGGSLVTHVYYGKVKFSVIFVCQSQ